MISSRSHPFLSMRLSGTLSNQGRNVGEESIDSVNLRLFTNQFKQLGDNSGSLVAARSRILAWLKVSRACGDWHGPVTVDAVAQVRCRNN
jgi:hypothetical protein